MNFERQNDTALAQKTITPPLYAIIMYNDDYTTMDFVVWVLISVLNLAMDTAYRLTMTIHEQGRAKVASLPKELAEIKVQEIERLAEQAEYPLKVTLEQE